MTRLNNNPHVVYWHISGSGKLELPLSSRNVTLMEQLGREVPVDSGQEDHITIPVSDRRYLAARNVKRDELISAFKNARIIE